MGKILEKMINSLKQERRAHLQQLVAQQLAQDANNPANSLSQSSTADSASLQQQAADAVAAAQLQQMQQQQQQQHLQLVVANDVLQQRSMPVNSVMNLPSSKCFHRLCM